MTGLPRPGEPNPAAHGVVTSAQRAGATDFSHSEGRRIRRSTRRPPSFAGRPRSPVFLGISFELWYRFRVYRQMATKRQRSTRKRRGLPGRPPAAHRPPAISPSPSPNCRPRRSAPAGTDRLALCRSAVLRPPTPSYASPLPALASPPARLPRFNSTPQRSPPAATPSSLRRGCEGTPGGRPHPRSGDSPAACWLRIGSPHIHDVQS
jgi:hypothetical protein